MSCSVTDKFGNGFFRTRIAGMLACGLGYGARLVRSLLRCARRFKGARFGGGLSFRFTHRYRWLVRSGDRYNSIMGVGSR